MTERETEDWGGVYTILLAEAHMTLDSIHNLTRTQAGVILEGLRVRAGGKKTDSNPWEDARRRMIEEKEMFGL